MVSPLEATLTHACTSEAAADCAVHVGEAPEQAAKQGAALPQQNSIAMSRRIFLIIVPQYISGRWTKLGDSYVAVASQQ